MSTKVIDRGWKKIKAEMKKFRQSDLVVGVLDSEVASYAVYNEFGAPKANIPERSFLRSTTADHADDIASKIDESLNKVIFGSMSATAALDRVGLHIQGLIQKTIKSGVGPENKPSTIRQKGHSKTLIGGHKEMLKRKDGTARRTKGGVKKFKITGGGDLMKSISFEIR